MSTSHSEKPMCVAEKVEEACFAPMKINRSRNRSKRKGSATQLCFKRGCANIFFGFNLHGFTPKITQINY